VLGTVARIDRHSRRPQARHPPAAQLKRRCACRTKAFPARTRPNRRGRAVMAAPAKRFCGGGGPVFDWMFSGAGEPDARGAAGASLDGDLAVTMELDAGTSHGRLVHLRREERRSSAMSGSRMPAREAGQRGWQGRGPHAGRARAPGAGGQDGNLPAPALPRPRRLCVWAWKPRRRSGRRRVARDEGVDRHRRHVRPRQRVAGTSRSLPAHPCQPACQAIRGARWTGSNSGPAAARPAAVAALFPRRPCANVALRTAVSPLVCSAAIILHAPSTGISTKNHVRSSRRPSRTPPARIARAGAGSQRASDSMWCVLSLPYTPSCHDAVLRRRRMRSLSARTWRADRAAGSGVHWKPENAGRTALSTPTNGAPAVMIV